MQLPGLKAYVFFHSTLQNLPSSILQLVSTPLTLSRQLELLSPCIFCAFAFAVLDVFQEDLHCCPWSFCGSVSSLRTSFQQLDAISYRYLFSFGPPALLCVLPYNMGVLCTDCSKLLCQPVSPTSIRDQSTAILHDSLKPDGLPQLPLFLSHPCASIALSPLVSSVSSCCPLFRMCLVIYY